MSRTEFNQVIVQALQQAPAGPDSALQTVLPAAQGGDPRAQALAAYWCMQVQRIPEAARWAERAHEGEFPYIGWWVGHQLIGQGDETLRRQGLRLMREAWNYPFSQIDPFGMAQQLVQQGLTNEAVEFLDSIVGAPAPWRGQVEQLLTQARDRVNEIEQVHAVAEAEKSQTLARLQAMQVQAGEELGSIQRLRGEVGEIASHTAAEYLKQGYEDEALRVQKRADLATATSIAMGVAIALVALVLASRLPQESTLEQGLEKAAFSVPFLLLNAYIARLASIYREEALRWRHIKLQIQTANPFLGALDETQRKETLALLATRFFPGQTMPMPEHAAPPSDLSGALASMFQSSAGRAKPESPTDSTTSA